MKSRFICCIKCVCIVTIINTFRACSKTSIESWSISEIKALVGFIVSHGMWPMHHRIEFWDRAALFVMNPAGISHQRSGNFRIQFNKIVSTKFIIAGSSCRYKVVKWLKKKFSDPKSAEILAYQLEFKLALPAPLKQYKLAVCIISVLR